MIRIVKIISTSIDNLSRRLIKFQGNGKDDIQEVINISQFGDDSNPIKDMVAIKVDTAIMGESVVIGYINTNQLAAVGEKRLFSTDENGNEKIFLWLKNDGTIEFGGNTDNIIGFAQTELSIDEIKYDINSLKNILSAWVPVPNDGGAALKAALASYFSQPLIEQITNGKKDELKTL